MSNQNIHAPLSGLECQFIFRTPTHEYAVLSYDTLKPAELQHINNRIPTIISLFAAMPRDGWQAVTV